MNSDRSMMAQKIVITCLFGIVSVLATHAVIEGDLFWHIRTGEFIWHHGSPPSEDPFTFTAQDSRETSDVLRRQIILKGYWVSQLLYYAIYSAMGIPGIVAFRALTVFLIALILYSWMKRRNVGFSAMVVFLVLVGLYYKNMGDRPQNLSFLFFAGTAALLDRYCRPHDQRAFPKPLLMLPPMMLLWSNMHGGYVMGVMLLMIYASGAVARMLRDPEHRDRYLRILAVIAAGIALSLVNPMSYHIYLFLFREMREGVQTLYVGEMMSPFMAASKFGDLQLPFWAFLGLSGIVLITRIRHITYERGLALVCLGILSLRAQRMIWFFLLMAPVVAEEMTQLLRNRFRTALRAAAALSVAAALFVLWDSRHGLLDFALDRSFPVKAVHFLNQTRPSGRLFNISDWGGYVMLNAPEYQVFDDGRRLSDTIEYVHSAVMLGVNVPVAGVPAWKKHLTDYHIDIMLIPYSLPLHRDLSALVLALYRDPEWALVFSDETALVYVRRGAGNEELIQRYSLPKDLSILNFIKRTPPDSRENIKAIADLYRFMGRPEAAESFYKLLKN